MTTVIIASILLVVWLVGSLVIAWILGWDCGPDVKRQKELTREKYRERQ